MINILKVPILLIGLLLLMACSDPDFETDRRVIFYNGVTGTWMLVIEGQCFIETTWYNRKIKITCKVSPETYKTHIIDVSDNVTPIIQDLEPKKPRRYYYNVIHEPMGIASDMTYTIRNVWER